MTMTDKLLETIALFITGTFAAFISLLAFAAASYFISARDRNRQIMRYIDTAIEEKEKAEVTD